LRDPRVTLEILQATPATIGREGLAIDRWDVGVIMLAESNSPEQAGAAPDNSHFQAAEVVAALSRKAIVLNADDTRATALVDSTRDAQIFWVVPDIDGALGSEFFRPNDAAIAIRSMEDGLFITISDARGVERIAAAPSAMTGRQDASREVRRAGLTAVAIARALGLSSAMIGEGLAAGPMLAQA
jgi:hypothetical protein